MRWLNKFRARQRGRRLTAVAGCCAMELKGSRSRDHGPPLDPRMLRCTYQIPPAARSSTKWNYSETSASCEFLRGGHFRVPTGSSAPPTYFTDEPSKGSGPWDSSFAQVAKTYRLRRSAALRTAWDVWEVNAGWVVWLDGAAVLMTRVTDTRLDPGADRSGGAWKGLEVALCVMKTATATSSPHSGD